MENKQRRDWDYRLDPTLPYISTIKINYFLVPVLISSIRG